MSEETIKLGCCSVLGDRPSQQDSMKYEWNGGTLLAAVCDGMGGMSGGERASAEAIECVFREFQAASGLEEQNVPGWLSGTFGQADRAVCGLVDAGGKPLGGGTTIVAALICDGQFFWGSVGDSRIYCMKKGELRVVNRQHNYNLRIQEMLEDGTLTEEQARTERLRGEALISYIGMGGLALVDTSPGAELLEDGDIILLCSDGLYKSLNDQQIQAITEESGGNMELAAERLCREAARLSVSKQDNTTVIAIRYCE